MVSAAVSACAAVLIYQVTVRQARISENQLTFSRKQTKLMEGQLVATEIAAKAASQSVEVAQKQSEIAETSLTNSQRPWIVVEVRVAGPMKYDANGASFLFDYVVANVGGSPALAVLPTPFIYSHTIDMPDQAQVLRDRVRGVTKFDSMGYTIGPNAQELFRIGQSVSYDEIRATVESYRFDGQATGILPIYLVGKISYKSALSRQNHETTFYYDILKLNDDAIPVVVGLSTYDIDINADRLVVRKNILFSTQMT